MPFKADKGAPATSGFSKTLVMFDIFLVLAETVFLQKIVVKLKRSTCTPWKILNIFCFGLVTAVPKLDPLGTHNFDSTITLFSDLRKC